MLFVTFVSWFHEWVKFLTSTRTLHVSYHGRILSNLWYSWALWIKIHFHGSFTKKRGSVKFRISSLPAQNVIKTLKLKALQHTFYGMIVELKFFQSIWRNISIFQNFSIIWLNDLSSKIVYPNNFQTFYSRIQTVTLSLLVWHTSSSLAKETNPTSACPRVLVWNYQLLRSVTSVFKDNRFLVISRTTSQADSSASTFSGKWSKMSSTNDNCSINHYFEIFEWQGWSYAGWG